MALRDGSLREDPKVYFNGINPKTGDYAFPPLTLSQYHNTIAEHLPRRRSMRGSTRDAGDWDIERMGWGVLFAKNTPPSVREALRPLLAHRREQANRQRNRFRELEEGIDASLPELERMVAGGIGLVDPNRFPLYLLIVASPEEIPFDFQYTLASQYAVGRLSFDTAEEYARYAESVVAAETGKVAPRSRRAVLFGIRNGEDPLAKQSAELLVGGLAGGVGSGSTDWDLEVVRVDAKRRRLEELLGGSDTPGFLFTAGHSVVMGPQYPEWQPRLQGGIMCSDWKGPHSGPVERDFYLCAEDIPDSANVAGLISFHFGCFTAGTPTVDSFAELNEQPKPCAPRAFVAALPKRLLAHPRGSALAFVGHVDRALQHSFLWYGREHGVDGQNNDSYTRVFESAIRELLNGRPLGSAMQNFGRRTNALAFHTLAQARGNYRGGRDPAWESYLWSAYNDARGYVILGDPYVRVAVEH